MPSTFRMLNNRTLLISREVNSEGYVGITHYSSGNSDIAISGFSLAELDELIKVASELKVILGGKQNDNLQR